MNALSAPAPRALVYRLLEAYCRDEGLALTAADAHGNAGCIEGPNGRRRYFVGTRFDLNTQGAAEVAGDKAYTAEFLRRAGLKVPAGLFILSGGLTSGRQPPEAVLDFAEIHEFPLYLKPNAGREGMDVLRVDGFNDLREGLRVLALRHDRLLLQQDVRGRELRVLVLDGTVVLAVERHPPAVTGDGRRSLAELIGADPRIDGTDARLDTQLAAEGLTRDSVPETGRTVTVLPVANLSAGGRAEIVTARLDPACAEIALAAAGTLALRYAAVDLILPERPRPDGAAVVLEVNAAPGLANLHRQGPEEARAVEAVYRQVFEAAFGGLRTRR